MQIMNFFGGEVFEGEEVSSFEIDRHNVLLCCSILILFSLNKRIICRGKREHSSSFFSADHRSNSLFSGLITIINEILGLAAIFSPKNSQA